MSMNTQCREIQTSSPASLHSHTLPQNLYLIKCEMVVEYDIILFCLLYLQINDFFKIHCLQVNDYRLNSPYFIQSKFGEKRKYKKQREKKTWQNYSCLSNLSSISTHLTSFSSLQLRDRPFIFN